MKNVDMKFVSFIIKVIGVAVFVIITFSLQHISDGIIFGFLIALPISILFYFVGHLLDIIHRLQRQVTRLQEEIKESK